MTKLHFRFWGRAWVMAIAAVFLSSFWPSNAFAQTQTIKIAAFGDSLVAGFGLAPGEAFPEQLQSALEGSGFTNIEIMNAGVSGDTTADALSRLDWSITEDVSAVIVELGANDGLRGLSVEQARKNLNAILKRFQERNIAVFLTGMEAPPNMGGEYQAAFRAIFPDLAKAYNVPLYPFFLEGVAAMPNLNQSDGIHPNAEGVAVIIDKMLPMLKDWISKL